MLIREEEASATLREGWEEVDDEGRACDVFDIGRGGEGVRREEEYEPRKSKPRSFLGATKALSDVALSFALLSNESEDECDGNDCSG